MAWSTREVADLAGTTLRAVRHYHEVGLLPEPERRSNGYKQYTVEHLLALLRISRLVDLGFSLTQIAEMGEDRHPEEALTTLDAQLAAMIKQLQRTRVELSLILRHRTTTDLTGPLGAVAGAAHLSAADRSFVTVMSRVWGPTRQRAWAELLVAIAGDPTDAELDALPADADEARRQDLAERMAPRVTRISAEHPDLMVRHPDETRSRHVLDNTAAIAMRELYNSAQLDVLRRVQALLVEAPDGPAR